MVTLRISTTRAGEESRRWASSIQRIEMMPHAVCVCRSNLLRPWCATPTKGACGFERCRHEARR